MTRKTYPICHFCEHPLNPNAEDDCDRVFVLPNGELCCPPCFKDYLLNELDKNMDLFAEKFMKNSKKMHIMKFQYKNSGKQIRY